MTEWTASLISCLGQRGTACCEFYVACRGICKKAHTVQLSGLVRSPTGASPKT